ncbi:MAG: hypothetical protein Q7S21_02965 [archaeon]|nr:hypothetical protein [archaeon]
MEFELLKEKEKQKIVTHFQERYAVPKDSFKDYIFLRNKHFVWLANKELEDFLSRHEHFYSIGFLFLMDVKTFKPTTAAIRFLEKNIKRNLLVLSEQQSKDFFSGRKFLVTEKEAKSLDSTGYIALCNEKYLLGSAWFDKKLLSVHPNISNTDYDKIEAQYFLKK